MTESSDPINTSARKSSRTGSGRDQDGARKTSRGSGLLIVLVLLLGAMGVAAAWPDFKPYAGILINRLGSVSPSESMARPAPSPQPAVDRLGMIEAALASNTLRQDLIERRLVAIEAQLSAVQTQRIREDMEPLRPPVASSALTSRPGEAVSRELLNGENAPQGKVSPGERKEPPARRLAERLSKGTLFLMAIRQLREAVDRGTPFETEYNVVHTLGGERVADFLPFLGPHMATGIPTRAMLTDRFHALAIAARKAATQSTDNWLEGRVVQFLASAIVVRRSDGDGAIAAIRRAERMLAEGDFTGCVEATKSAQGPGATVLLPWLQAAMARVNADRVLSEALSTAIAYANESGE